MKTNLLFNSFFVALICFACLAHADVPKEQIKTETEPKPLERIARPMRTSFRHIEGKGVGYNKGYTTLEIFLAPNPDRFALIPFLDLRGHVFDDGKFAANAGIGMRGLASCRVYGASFYYDYRQTKRYHYNQVSCGFESLGRGWDFRGNGYLPVGKKQNYKYMRQAATSKSKFEYAMTGFDAEAAFHILKNRDFDLYAAAGPYYYRYQGKQAAGGRVRIVAQIYEYLTLEAINTYDSRFHEIVQGVVGVNIPFGPRQTPSKNKKLSRCEDAYLLSQRLVQDVQRQEIVVAGHSH